MPRSSQRPSLKVCQTPLGCLAPGSPPEHSCQRRRRPSPDRSAAPVIPTRIKSASTTATWISSGSTPPNALCPMECRATEALSESGVLLLDNQLNMRGQRLNAAFVLCLMQTLSATIFVCQVLCRQCHPGVSAGSLALDDSLTSLHLLLFFLGDWTLHSFAAPSLSIRHSCRHRYTHSQGKNFGASSIRPSAFKNSSANSVQIPGGYSLFVPS